MAKNSKSNDWLTYGRLLSYVVSYWPYFVISILGFVLFAASQIAIADLIQFIVDSLNGEITGDGGIVASLILKFAGGTVASENARDWIAIAVLFIGLGRGLGFFLGNYYMAYIARFLVHNLRCHIFDHLMVVPSREYDQHSTGHLVSKIIFNVEQVTGAATNALKIIVREGVFTIGLVCYLFYANWQLSLFFFLALPFVAIIVMWVGKRFRKISEKIQDSMGEVTQAANESISAYKEVRVFGAIEDAKQKFYGTSERNLKQSMKMAFYNAISPPVIQQPIAVVLAFLIWFGLGLSNDMSAGQFVAYLTVALLLPKPIRQLSEVYSTIQKGLAAAHDIFDFMDSEAEQDDGDYQIDRVKGLVEFKNLNFRYSTDTELVLKNINLTVEAGQTVALVGSSGSGKSTLVNLITRFYQFDDGEVLLDGVNLNEYKLENLRNQIALVTQSVTLFNDTIQNNIAYGVMRDASDDEIHEAITSAHALEFIRRLPKGLDTVTGEDGVMLSGGQRQRLAIARALLKDAPLLILDEATSALDNESERHIQQALETVMKGRTTIVVAHRLSTIENADKIVVLEAGEIVEQGSHAQLIAQKGRYYKLHANQFAE
mgnify:FL=1